MTYTYAVLDVSPAAYAEIRSALEAAGYEHVFHQDGPRDREVIDMHGISLRATLPSATVELPPAREEQA